ncbi:MAG: hypothetical protein KME27_10940 [Lyngbya sp. HA4199-MV5]|jgi:hypothetical protein|nr:hypothetical protein [Lyngbya sp. HA4199-MV5]
MMLALLTAISLSFTVKSMFDLVAATKSAIATHKKCRQLERELDLETQKETLETLYRRY